MKTIICSGVQVEQLAQKRLHLLLCKCFASLWPSTRVLTNPWSTQYQRSLIIVNNTSKFQQRLEEQPIHHCDTDLRLMPRNKREVSREKLKTGKVEVETGAAGGGRERGPGPGHVYLCTHTLF